MYAHIHALCNSKKFTKPRSLHIRDIKIAIFIMDNFKHNRHKNRGNSKLKFRVHITVFVCNRLFKKYFL